MLILLYLFVGIQCHLFNDDLHLSTKSFQIHRQVTNTGDNDFATEMPVDNQNNLLYFINIDVGTPAQTFKLQMDSGSSILWIGSQSCPDCMNPVRFIPQQSTTYISLNEQYQQKYGIGYCAGVFSQDNLHIPNTNITLPFKFLLVDQMKDFHASFQGIMGLSNWATYQNMFELAYNQGEIKSPLFGFKIRQVPKQSYIYYDEWNPEVLMNTTWVPTSLTYRWTVWMTGVFVNSHDVTNLIVGNSRHALMDSGASCIWIEDQIVEYLWSNFFSTICISEGNCPCESPLYPTLTFYFQGAKVIVNAKRYLYKYPNRPFCTPCIRPMAQGEISILGDPVMQSYVAIMDKANQKIGMYKTPSVLQIGWAGTIVITVAVGLMLLMLGVFAFIYLKTQ